jgi:hypothetical protein
VKEQNTLYQFSKSLMTQDTIRARFILHKKRNQGMRRGEGKKKYEGNGE